MDPLAHWLTAAQGLVTRRSTVARLLFALFATVQLALPPVAAWADAAVEREASARAQSRTHIEAHTENGCARMHPADCALCQVASRIFATAPEGPSCRVSVGVVEQPAIAEVPRRALAGRTRLSLARAPPLG
jgi:hypothetical protein